MTEDAIYNGVARGLSYARMVAICVTAAKIDKYSARGPIVDDEVVLYPALSHRVRWGFLLSYHDCFMSVWVNDDPSLQVYNAWPRRRMQRRGHCFWLLFCHDNLNGLTPPWDLRWSRFWNVADFDGVGIGRDAFAFVSSSLETLGCL
ncbi:hypothetical protein Nepgr_032585 [Nepenthes gracilis]|uniref:Uncharacterized protein n=1 Tax=Nepenthes gracilis TaxID=150966 RepID=A0AAD3TJQ9_NEPGR|nr:hypothetical protein Nepgr_032585 [Nepenthes gracilis]